MSDDAETPRKPDALILPEGWKHGESKYLRLDSLLSIAEPILGIPFGKGQLRKQPGDRCFITGSPHDTLVYPHGHARQGQPRYDWQPHESGMVYGFLLDPADVAEPLTPDQQAVAIQRGKAELAAAEARKQNNLI